MMRLNRFEFFKLSSVQPIKGKFKEQFDSLSGQEREQLILDYVTSGLQPTPDLVEINITDPKNKDISLTLEVMPQYFSIEGRPVQMTPITAEKIAKHYGLSMPTKEITMAVYANATHVLQGKPDMKLLGGSSEKLSRYTDQVLAGRKSYDIKPGDIVVGEYKELELPSQGGNLHASGWITSSGEKAKEDAAKFHVAQNFRGSSMHDTAYLDYSHAVRFVGKATDPFDKSKISIDQLTSKAGSDSKYTPYARLIDGGKTYSNYKAPEKKKDDEGDSAPAQKPGATEKPKTPSSKPEAATAVATTGTPATTGSPKTPEASGTKEKAKPEVAFSEIDQFLNQFRSATHERRHNIVKRAKYIKIDG